MKDEAANAINYISGTKLDDRIIRLDWDIGFHEGRQFGRGRSGGQVSVGGRGKCAVWYVCICVQVRDEYRQDYDEDRGGFGGRAKPL